MKEMAPKLVGLSLSVLVAAGSGVFLMSLCMWGCAMSPPYLTLLALFWLGIGAAAYFAWRLVQVRRSTSA